MQKSLHVWKKKLIILISQSLNLAGKGHLKSSLRGETWDIEHKTNHIQLSRYKVYGEKTWRWYCIHESQFYAYCENFRISLEESLSLDIFKEYLNNRIWPLQQDQVPHEISQGFCFVQVTRESFQFIKILITIYWSWCHKIIVSRKRKKL